MFEGNVERMGQTEMVLAAYRDERESQDDLVRMYLDKPAGVVNITNVMEDAPTAPGVWRRIGKEINSCWELYPLNVAESIFSMFCSGGNSVQWVDCTANARKRKREAEDCTLSSCSTAPTHRADFETMKEIDLLTGTEIDISIVEATISSINYTPIEEVVPIEAGVWWKDDSGKWNCYAEQAVHDIRKAWRRGHHCVTLKRVVTGRYPQGVEYIINLIGQMQQTNPITGRQRTVKIVSSDCLPREASPSSGGCNLTVFSLAMELFRGSLQKLLSDELIGSMVTRMVHEPHEILAVEPSKHLKDGDCHLLYQKFRNAYETLIRRVPGCCGQLMRLTTRTHTRADKEKSLSNSAAFRDTKGILLRHAFYQAPSAEVQNILENGLEGSRHSMENFAFSSDYYEHSKAWESPTYSLLLFLVVVPRCSKGTAGFADVIPVASVDHQLPMAVVTLRNRTHPEPELANHDSGQSGATDSDPFDCAGQNDSGQPVLCSTGAGLEPIEITTTPDLSMQIPVLPSKSEEDMFLLFKLYCPTSEKLRMIGGRVVPVGGRPTQIFDWLRNSADIAPDAELRLYKEDSSTCLDPSLTYAESQLEDGSVVAYNIVLIGKERSSYRCPDLPSFREHCRNRQVIHFRRKSNPTVDEFSVELSSQDTYSDAIERVAKHFDMEDANRVKLYFNDCFLQLPKPLHMDHSFYSSLLANAYCKHTSILYFEILDCHPPELDGVKTLMVDFRGGKDEKLSLDIKLSKRSTVKDAVDQLRGMVNDLRAPNDRVADAEMRIFEINNYKRIVKIHPPNEIIGYVSCREELKSFTPSLRAMEILEDMGPQDRLFQVRHFYCPPLSHKCEFFEDPFLMVVREHETLASVKERMKGKEQMTEEGFLRCRFALLTAGRRECLRDDDLVVSRMQKFSQGFYDPVQFFLGLEHPDASAKQYENVLEHATPPLKRRVTHPDVPAAGKRASKSKTSRKSTQAKSNAMSDRIYPDQNSEPRENDTLQNQAPGSGQAEPTQLVMNSETAIQSPQHGKDQVGLNEELVLTVVDPSPNQRSCKCARIAPKPVADYKASLPYKALDVKISYITVPDPEFHNFDLIRTEKDLVPGQVWAIYDNHDGMPRFYGKITQVCRSPFKVELSWLEPHRRRKWWVETTGVSITCGEYEISLISEIEEKIGVFSHKVHERAVTVRGLIEIYPRQGEVWAIFSNWDDMHMLGPKPVLTPSGIFSQAYEYHIVQMLDDYTVEDGVPAVRLLKTRGFKTVFHPQTGPHGTKTYLPRDLRKFSHCIPAAKMKNRSIPLPPESVELDPAALPAELTVIDGPLPTGNPI